MAGLENIPPALRAALKKELEADERIEWVEQPIPRLLAWKSKKMLATAAGWVVMCAAIAIGAIYNPEKASPLLFGFMMPFIFIGVVLLLMPFQLMANARRTLYVVTDQRAMILVKVRHMKVRSIYPIQIREISKTERADGSGDVIFAGIEEFGDEGARYTGLEGFEGVPNADSAERALRALIANR